MSGDAGAVSAALSHLGDYLGWHVLLSLSAMLIGVSISLPLAVLCARLRLLRATALGFAGIIQTIPSLALLALFYPLLLGLSAFTRATFGIGFRALGFLPALAALALYSMLPVLRNTIAGLDGVDPAVKKAARGVGMTHSQMLFLVELPLAAPVILAGIRIAAVWVIGTATLSTPVGQTSLGNYIFTGLQTENWVFVLFGCGAAAVLTLLVDRLLALAEAGVVRRSKLRIAAAGLGLVLVFGAALLPLTADAGSRPAVVGTKNFEEQYILGALIEDRLRAAGYSTVRRDGLGSTVIFDALAAGEIDVYVDYSGTVWADDMKRRDRPGRRAVLAQMTDWLRRTRGIRCLGGLGFENAYAFAMRRDRAAALGIHSLADLARFAPALRIGGDYEIFSRPEWRAVEQVYGVKFGTERQYQSNFLYRAVASGDVDVVSAFSTDGRIPLYDLKVLSDPKGALPPYDAVLLVSPARAKDANFIAALTPLLGAIDLGRMQRANLMADREKGKRSPEEIAADLDAFVAARRLQRGRK
ncbi:MAG TPA: ABC transporter permease/substrate-binding protein [Rhizomicrobium sp.]|jgi:osmoprotectant transport system permease protein|nr:ABC transporter permease/substrate-binding protein [Rhizomicrobium sp.]